MKKFLAQANWDHGDFGTVAKFFGNTKWTVTSEMLDEIV